MKRTTTGPCPTCGFPPGQPGYLRAEVGPGHPDFGKALPCPACHSLKLVERRQPQSQLEGWLAEASFENYWYDAANQAVVRAAYEFARKPRGWLTLWGGYGCGKTHLLAAIANRCRANRIAAEYYTLPDWLDRLRQDPAAYLPILERACQVPLLLLDEVDKVRWSDWAVEKIYQLADARYRNLKTHGAAFALNRDPRQLLSDPPAAGLGYLFSRMADARCQLLQLHGADARPMLRRLG
jgi:DNA replication protein DnaC